MSESYVKIAQLRDVDSFRRRLDELGLGFPVDDVVLSAEEGSPLATPVRVGEFEVGNRWCIHPMEGWDAHADGSPSPHTLRRWRNFGLSGAKLIWGGEAAAVRNDGRANPRQTLAVPANQRGLSALLTSLRDAHRDAFGTVEDLFVGLQLTHSGRFCRPNDQHLEPRIAYHHPLLDEKFGIRSTDDAVVWTDAELTGLIDDYVRAASLARRVGFHFVDIKACHGYLIHEFLSARSRAGPFGGDLRGRTRLLRTIIERIRHEVSDLMVAVRLSIFDGPPYVAARGVGHPMPYEHLLPYQFGFGVCQDDPRQIDLSEPIELIAELERLGVTAINVTCGSPYYNPHIQRPAIFPPSDGYQPPEDPLVGVARQLEAARLCKQTFPKLTMIGTGYSYLQDYLPHVAQATVRGEWIDVVGIGRMVLSYPEMPADTLAGRSPRRKLVCRTFSDCTTAPRNGLVSGCFPLDAYYKALPEAETLKKIKQQLK